MNISKQTAMDIALAYREVETAEKLLADIVEALDRRETPDIRDADRHPCRRPAGAQGRDRRSDRQAAVG